MTISPCNNVCIRNEMKGNNIETCFSQILQVSLIINIFFVVLQKNSHDIKKIESTVFLKGQESAKFFSFNFFLMYFSSNTIKALKYLFKLIISWDHSAAFFCLPCKKAEKKSL